MKTVLDASTLLAWLQDEPGAETVDIVLKNAVLSTVNWAEVYQKALAHGIGTDNLREDMELLGVHILPFTTQQAEYAADLWVHTRTAGLSLGDRACLALASDLKLPVFTTDRIWTELGLELEIQAIR
ncbi:MAG: type II toxin-antitoxin system VapC family toxin [Gammaproteobacteria bacterium]|nr:type II toxin-antitoxin system VapC family toxin [Gammaproteobacteria bacterium]